jgi:hypothetical protein
MITSFFQICPNALLITCKNNSISNLWSLSHSITQVQSWPNVGEGVANSQLYQETVVKRFRMTNQSGLTSQSSPATNYRWEVTFLQRKYTCLQLRSSWVPEVTPHLDAHLGSTASFRCTTWFLHSLVWTIWSTMVWICVFLKALESRVSNLLWQFRDPETLLWQIEVFLLQTVSSSPFWPLIITQSYERNLWYEYHPWKGDARNSLPPTPNSLQLEVLATDWSN